MMQEPNKKKKQIMCVKLARNMRKTLFYCGLYLLSKIVLIDIPAPLKFQVQDVYKTLDDIVN